MLEKRIPSKTLKKSTTLPVDFIKMIQDVFQKNFEPKLKVLAQQKKNPKFHAYGEIFSDEIQLAVSLLSEDSISATTIYASSDFDPKASSPTAEDLFQRCVDGIASVFDHFMSDPKKDHYKIFLQDQIGSLEGIPTEWNEMQVDQKKIYVRIDKANLFLDNTADEWLKKNDPTHQEREEKEHEEMEDLFITGKPDPKKGHLH